MEREMPKLNENHTERSPRNSARSEGLISNSERKQATENTSIMDFPHNIEKQDMIEVSLLQIHENEGEERLDD